MTDTLWRLVDDQHSEKLLGGVCGRVDNLEAGSAYLQARQFSTTTKLMGEVIFAVAQYGIRSIPTLMIFQNIRNAPYENVQDVLSL